MAPVTTLPIGPETGTGTPPGNVNGQAIAITVFSTVKRGTRALGVLPMRSPDWLHVLFKAPPAVPPAITTLRRLSFIHFARWSLIKELPHNGAPQPDVQLHHQHLYFESNFNGGWEEYIDAFSYVLERGMALFWGSSYGFPGAVPPGPFKTYIKTSDRRLIASHFYSAYPQATTTMITDALKVQEELADLRERAADLTADEFSAAFTELTTRAQRWF